MAIGKNKNFNYIFLFYDVNEKRVNKVFKICKKYLIHHQRSVFRGEISPSNFIKLRKELKDIIDKKEDYISFIKFISDKYFDEETIGTPWKEDEDIFV